MTWSNKSAGHIILDTKVCVCVCMHVCVCACVHACVGVAHQQWYIYLNCVSYDCETTGSLLLRKEMSLVCTGSPDSL